MSKKQSSQKQYEENIDYLLSSLIDYVRLAKGRRTSQLAKS